jgi:cysteine desulfuration protein SufE
MDIAEITDNLTFLDDWEDRYRYVIELGQQLEPIEDAERNPANKVEGCVSQVWLVTDRKDEDGNPILTYRGDSDAMIVKGLVAILIALYSGRSPSEIAETDALETFDELGLREHLTTQRSNGLVAMVKRIRSDAARLSQQS